MVIAISDFCYVLPRFRVRKKHSSSGAQNAPGNRQNSPFKMRPSHSPCQPLRRSPSGYYSMAGRAHLAGSGSCKVNGVKGSNMSTNNVHASTYPHHSLTDLFHIAARVFSPIVWCGCGLAMAMSCTAAPHWPARPSSSSTLCCTAT